MTITNKNIWIVDDDRSIRWILEKSLTKASLNVKTFASADQVLNELKINSPDVIVTDIRMPGTDGLTLLKHLNKDFSKIPVIIMTAYSDLDSTVAAYQGGAFEYLSKPFDINDAVDLIQRALNQIQQTKQQTTQVLNQPSEIIGSSPAMQEVFRAIGRLSRSNITVLITGESGTGKELVAHALHRHSPRQSAKFIALNTAAIPRELLESELFGHERGAFTGALSQYRGRFEQADGGTLFLDEIGDMPAELQTRLLRVLADGTFFRVGGHTSIKVDVRIIAATHQNLEQHVKLGQFREDLYHRLNVIRVHLPALRQRYEDIPILMQYFLESSAQKLGTEPKTLHKETSKYLTECMGAGNVRQLENTCHWLTVMASSNEILLKDLPPELVNENNVNLEKNAWDKELIKWAKLHLHSGNEQLLKLALPKFEKALIGVTLEYTHGRIEKAAKLLGWGRNTLARKIKEFE
jgi:two-component system nitrogen regulation response regulator GlnG